MDGQNSVEQQIMMQQNAQNPQPQSNDGANSGSADSQLATLVADIDRRLRTIEERSLILRKKLQLTDENLLESERSFSRELRDFSTEILTMKHQLNDFSDKVLLFESELQNTAKTNDMKVLEKYLLMWSPGLFVTRNELKEYLRQRGLLNEDDMGE